MIQDNDRVSGRTHMFQSFMSKKTCQGYHRTVQDTIQDLGRSLMLQDHHKPVSALTDVTWMGSQKVSGHYRKYMCTGLYQQIMLITQRSPKICFKDTCHCLELCRRVRDTKDTTYVRTYIPGTPNIGGKHSICVRDTTVVRTTTCLSGKLFRLVGDTRDVSLTPDMCQGNK